MGKTRRRSTSSLAEVLVNAGLTGRRRRKVEAAVQDALADCFDRTVALVLATIQEWPDSENMNRTERYAKTWHHAVTRVLHTELPRRLKRLKPKDDP